MKKVLAFCLSIVIFVSLCSCGVSTNTYTNTENQFTFTYPDIFTQEALDVDEETGEVGTFNPNNVNFYVGEMDASYIFYSCNAISDGQPRTADEYIDYTESFVSDGQFEKIDDSTVSVMRLYAENKNIWEYWIWQVDGDEVNTIHMRSYEREESEVKSLAKAIQIK